MYQSENKHVYSPKTKLSFRPANKYLVARIEFSNVVGVIATTFQMCRGQSRQQPSSHVLAPHPSLSRKRSKLEEKTKKAYGSGQGQFNRQRKEAQR